MFRCLFSFFFLFSFLHADWDHLFPENEDPTVVHHVNVISGQLNFSLIDTVIQGPLPFPITRTYSSSGALERLSRQDLFFRALQDNLAVQGGWSFLPELHLLIESEYSRKTLKAYLEATEYIYAHKQEDHVYFLKPSHGRAQHSGAVSARNNLLNYRLKVDTQKGRAVLYLPSGGSRVYEGPKLKRHTYYPIHYKLKQERLPSKHIIDYKKCSLKSGRF
ncbi:MAG: DUF6531 domain-containing protein [Chlamydiota bacterium]